MKVVFRPAARALAISAWYGARRAVVEHHVGLAGLRAARPWRRSLSGRSRRTSNGSGSTTSRPSSWAISRTFSQVLPADVGVGVEEADRLQPGALAPGHQRAELLAVLGADREDHRLRAAGAASAGRPSGRRSGTFSSAATFITAVDGPPSIEPNSRNAPSCTSWRALASAVARLVVVVQRAQHDACGRCTPPAALTAVEVQLHAAVRSDAVARSCRPAA